MRTLILITLLIISLPSTHAQMAMSFEEAIAQGLDFQKLDSIYPAGIGNDSIAVFSEQEDEYVKAYYGMLQDLGNFLNNNDYYWGGAVRCFNRIYFDADGSIDYYLYEFEADLPQTKKNEFKELLGQFIITYKFGLAAKSRFAQCSPANYRDPL